MNTDLMFSSAHQGYHTPSAVVADLATVFPWDLDVCADGPNVCANYYDIDTNGLIQTWHGLCYMNPPYGRGIGKWLKKAANSVATTVCLIPARTDTRWWHTYVSKGTMIVFIKGRLHFGSEKFWIEKRIKELWALSKLDPTYHKVQKRTVSAFGAIGGALCDDRTKTQAKILFNVNKSMTGKPKYTFSEWVERSNVKVDAAPFPSAFVVFGELNKTQKDKLASYGWTPCRKSQNI